MTLPAFVPLQGRFVRLEPFTQDMKADVRAAVDCDPEIWAIMTSSAHGEHFDTWWADLLGLMAKGDQLPFAIRRLSDDRIVGATSYLTLRPAHRGVEIGTTFIHPDARSSPVNPEAKLLLLEHAFAAGMVRVEFAVDVRNTRSLAAVAKLGAVREGTLRRHKITWTGHIRDTAIHSITEAEWPDVKAGLEARLASFPATDG